tara:strand:- start:397 stop:576 length:180 start_codon:yes stop_codon:yes gene_type:complete
MNEELTTLKKTIERTTTDVINQLHNLNADDRSALLIEHIETLCNPYESEEVLVVPKVKN